MICYTIYGNNFCQNFQSKSPEISKHSRICYFDDDLAPNWLPARVKIPKNTILFEYIWFFVYFPFRLVPFSSSSVFSKFHFHSDHFVFQAQVQFFHQFLIYVRYTIDGSNRQSRTPHIFMEYSKLIIFRLGSFVKTYRLTRSKINEKMLLKVTYITLLTLTELNISTLISRNGYCEYVQYLLK